jgi:serine-type D-Ala-D-Ala carboxypeptidase/endopeptidase (penicillin-binding protein 4)
MLLAVASASAETLQKHLTHELSLAGSHSGGYVYDISAKQVLFSERAAVRRPPASVEKLYTATTTLNRLGATTRLQTEVLGVGQLSPTGVWEGNLYLHGGGDPTFGTSSFIHSHYGGVGTPVSALATKLAQAGIRGVSGKLEGDESYFDSLRGEPSSDYQPDPFLEGTLSALAFNRGATGTIKSAHAPAAYAAHELLLALRALHIKVSGGTGAASTPAGASVLASIQSPTITELLGLTLPPSDNFFAETLVKDIGARFGGAGTTAAGAQVVAQTVSTLFGLHPRVLDGSGLSAADATSPYEVTDMLVEIEPTPIGSTLRGDLAVAGKTGTLSERMRGTSAAGRCKGKTGTLTGASNLAGYCEAADGDLLAFAFFNDGISTGFAHQLQDNMTISLANY